MQRLEVSISVLPLEGSLGIKWLSNLLFLLKTSDDMDGHSCPTATGCANFSRKLSQS